MNRIIELVVSNFKRIKVATIRPDPDSATVRISGANGSGKSSILDAIQAALEGKPAMPAVPVRVGEDMAEIVVDCGDVQIRRRIMPDGHGTLKITTKDGMSPAKPQTWLDERIGAIAFDPLSFMQEDGKKQADIIRKLASCDVSDLDGEHQRVFDERAAINRDMKNAIGARNTLPPLVGQDVPDAEVSASEILAQIDRAQQMSKERSALEAEQSRVQLRRRHNEDNDKRDREDIERLTVDEKVAFDQVNQRTDEMAKEVLTRLESLDTETAARVVAEEKRLDDMIAELEERLTNLRTHRAKVGIEMRADAATTRLRLTERNREIAEGATLELATVSKRFAEGKAVIGERIAKRMEDALLIAADTIRIERELAALVMPDLVALRRALTGVEQTNAQVRVKARWRDADKRVADCQAESDAKTGRLGAIAAERQARIAAVKYPIAGLGFSADGTLTFNGFPLEQVSQAEQIRVAMSIGLAQNPELRVVLLRSASLLDKKSLAIVADEAERFGAQVWLERCTVDGSDDEVIISDGEVAS